MNAIDLIALFPIGYLAVVGFRKGLLREIFAILGIIVGTLVSLKFAHMVLGQLDPKSTSAYMPYVAHLLVFIIVVFVIHLLGRILEKILKLVQLNLPNRLAGSVLGILKACLLLGVFFWLSDRIDLVPQETRESSFIYEFLSKYTPMALDYMATVLPFVGDIISEVEQFFNSLMKEV